MNPKGTTMYPSENYVKDIRTLREYAGNLLDDSYSAKTEEDIRRINEELHTIFEEIEAKQAIIRRRLRELHH